MLVSRLAQRALVMSALLLAFVVVGPVFAQSAPPTNHQAYARAGNRDLALSPGVTLAQGTKTADAKCDVPHVRVGQRGQASGSFSGSITVKITDSCAVVVNALEVGNATRPATPPARPSGAVQVQAVEKSLDRPAPSASAPESGDQNVLSSILRGPEALAQTVYTGWAHSRYIDCCDITLTEVYASFRYVTYQGTVGNGHNLYNWYWWNWDGWHFHWVDSSWNPNGPSVVSDQINGSSAWFGESYSHWQQAQFEGYGWGGYNWWCEFSGQLVPVGSVPCYGGRV
jgi:hypothetical protein